MVSEFKNYWNNILDILRENINEKSFKTWFNESEVLGVDKNLFSIKVPTQFIADYLNRNYREMVSEICEKLYQKKYNFNFLTDPKRQKNNIPFNTLENPIHQTKLNHNYTFEQFVVGKNNMFAHSAALSVSENPGRRYNPLFIYGNSGMGKTHLMQAIGNLVIDNEHPNNNIFYTSTEEFTNEMINAIKTNKMVQFRNKYRNFDYLLIDDIHFLSKKEGTQEEFFHTFNSLYEKKKQIILTSDRPPKDIPDLKQRLVTRFEWGLVADLTKPNQETREAILQKKMENENIYLKNDVVNFIAENITDNIRALEGSLIRILAYASYNNIETEEITVELVEQILNDMISQKIVEINIRNITKQVCTAYNITENQIIDKTRKKNIAFPRQIGMYLANLLIPQLSLKEIANYYRRKDHTTVIHAIKTIERHFREDKNFRIQIERLINDIKK